VFMATYSTNLNDIKDWTPLGSGFFTEGSNTILVITCNHVVDAGNLAKKDLFVGVDTEAGFRKLRVAPVYRDVANDVAVLGFLDALEGVVKNREVSILLFGDETSVVEGRGALVIGYPLGLGTEGDKNHPIVRLGMVAQQTEGSRFLMDAVASHGNSGSPVFSLRPNGTTLLGMITSQAADAITLLDERGQLAAKLPYNSGLASAIKASVILDAIKAANNALTMPPSKGP
jgi:S1-C subfamily serine protease